MKRLSILIYAGVIVSIFTGCASPPGDTLPTTPQSSPVATDPTTQDAGADQTPADADPRTCLLGDWLADNAFFLTRIQEFGDEVHGVSGRVLLQFAADGALTTEYQDWTISAVVDGIDVQIIRAGVDTGTYAASDHTVELNETEIGSTLTMKRGGLEMAIDPHPSVYGGSPYACSEDAATIDTDDGILRLTR